MPSKENSIHDARSRAAKKLGGSDRIGLAAQVLATAGGAGAGASIAGSAASAAGATTLMGSTTLGGLLGGVFVTATPVGWVVGSAVVGAAAFFGLAQLARSGGRQDWIRRRLAKKLLKGGSGSAGAQQLDRLAAVLEEQVARGAISVAKAGQVISLVAAGKLAAEVATERLAALPALSQVDPV